MRIEELKEDKLNDFLAYCRIHRNEVDDSFLYEDDFKSNVDNQFI